MNKNELKDVLCGASQVSYGTPIQAIARYLRRSESSSHKSEKSKSIKEEETERLCQWIEEHNFWYTPIDISSFISAGAEQRVYLEGEKDVLKLNDGIYYATWLDYLYNLLLNNYFFPDTAYELLGFYREDKTLYAVVRQSFVKENEPTSLEKVKAYLKNNGFETIRNNDYRNPELGIILEDLHDENVLTKDGILFFIDTVFYLENDFWDD
ncbi:putative polyvalent protein kinase domain-containing protein [Capnocytophaga granulosa]